MSTRSDQPADRDAQFEEALRSLPREVLIALLMLEARRVEKVHDCGGCARLALASGNGRATLPGDAARLGTIRKA